MTITYSAKPTADEVQDHLTNGLHLLAHGSSSDLKDWLWAMMVIVRWRLAEMAGTAPDERGRIISGGKG